MAKNNLLKGSHPDIVNANITTLKNAGYEHSRAVGTALRHANKKHGSKVKKITAAVTKKEPVQVKVKGPGDFNA